jgi:hypothetical protein
MDLEARSAGPQTRFKCAAKRKRPKITLELRCASASVGFMLKEVAVSICQREDTDVEVAVSTEYAESLYQAIRKANLSPATPRPYVCCQRLTRTKDGNVATDEPAQSYMDVSDPEKKIEGVVAEWLSHQGDTLRA